MPTLDELYAEHDQLKEAGKLEEAAAKLQEAIAIDPQYVLGHTALSVILTRLQRFDEAIAHGLKVCELEPNEPFNYSSLSVTYQRAGKYYEAEEALARARMLQQSR